MATQNTSPAKKKKKRRRKQHRGLTVFFTVFLMLFMIGVVTGGLVAYDIFTDVGILSFGPVDTSKEVAGVDYIDLDAYVANQSQTTIIYGNDEDGNEIELARLHGTENRIWCSLDEVCEDMKNAVVALEDKRFYMHDGVDWVRTIGVVVEYHFSQGGSTITQQLIKNLTGENSRTFKRKYSEIKNALALEKHFDKDTILEAYLNTIYLDMGCYGVKTAAEYYFGKTPDQLTLMESAILASITNAPRKYDPIVNYDNNRKRAVECLDDMLEQGYISQERYNAALEEEVHFIGVHQETEEDEYDESAVEITTESEVQSYYVDYIIEQVMADLQTTYGYSESEAFRKVYFGGLKIYGAVDMRIQGIMEDVYYNRSVCFPDEEDTPEDPAIQSSMIIVDYEGRIMGTVGRIGKKTANRTLNMSTSSRRQPGSCIKPLSCYCPAIELNTFYWSSYIPNYGIDLYGNGEIWPTNYGGDPGNPGQLMTLDEAIAPSKNTVPARIVRRLTPTTCYEFLRDRFHITTLEPADEDYAPMAIGAMAYGVTPLEMAAAYATFGNGGLYYRPWSYYKVTNASGSEIVLEPDRTPERVISEGAADVMLHLLQCVVNYSSGTGYRFKIDGFKSFCKTGTTSDNCDKWIVGGTPYYVCATWAGFEYNREININYYGSNPAGNAYKYVMNRVHRTLDEKEFTYGEECVKKAYCTETGLLATSRCWDTEVGYYKADNLPGYCHYCSGGSVNNETTTASSSTTEAKTTQAPAPTEPPATEPPATEPPATEPPASETPEPEPEQED